MALRRGIVERAFLRLALAGASSALLLLAGFVVSPSGVSADLCEDTAAAIGSGDSDSDSCDTLAPDQIFANNATAENDGSSFFSAGFAFARAETSNASTGRPTYAWSFNNDTILGLALSSNNVDATDVNGGGPLFGPSGSAFAIAQNNSSILVFTAAQNAVIATDITSQYEPFERNVYSQATAENCILCSTTSSNTVLVDDADAGDSVSLGSIWSGAENIDAFHSSANATNWISIEDAEAGAYILFGDPDGNGSFARAANLGGIIGGDCEDCISNAYNAVSIKDVDATDSIMQAARAAAVNEYSSGSFALGVNLVDVEDVNVLDGTAFIGQIFSYAFNTYSPDSWATSLNNLVVGGEDSLVVADNAVSVGSNWAQANNYYCDDCKADAVNNVAVAADKGDAVAVGGSVFDGGTWAYAYNEGPQPPGFEDNTAKAYNTVDIGGLVAAANNVVTENVYSEAHNYTGGYGSGSCYDCYALADNTLKIHDAVAGDSIVDTSVYATAENYNSEDATAKSHNKVKIEDSNAGGNIIGDGEGGFGSVYAHSQNRYCEYCLARADNYVSISNANSGTTILNAHAYAWAENNLSDVVSCTSADVSVCSASAADTYSHHDSGPTAIAYNTLIIKDSLTGGDTVRADVYSCASNNVGGFACGAMLRESSTGSQSTGPETTETVYDGECIDCYAFADNFVKLTGSSNISDDANYTNNVVNSFGGVYAHAENTAQGDQMSGVCNGCLALAYNTVNASIGSTVDGTTSATAINENGVNTAALAVNNLDLANADGHGEASAYNTHSTDAAAVAVNLASANSGSDVQSGTEAINDNATGAITAGVGVGTATNGGSAENHVSAVNGSSTANPVGGGAVAVGLANADDTNASSSSTADLSNNGSSSGAAVSISFDSNGNVAVAVVVTAGGTGVAYSAAVSGDGSATADGQADGSGGATSGDVTFTTGGTPTAHTSTSP